MYTTGDYGMTVVLGPTWRRVGLRVLNGNTGVALRNKLVTLGHASVERVMGRYITPDTVLRDRRQK